MLIRLKKATIIIIIIIITENVSFVLKSNQVKNTLFWQLQDRPELLGYMLHNRITIILI